MAALSPGAATSEPLESKEILTIPAASLPHPPASEAERALDAMVHLTYTDRSDIVDFIVKRPWRDRSLERRYAPYFSKKLQAAWALAEKEAVEKECGGQYIKGDICGLDFSPLSCAQDHSTIGYTYRTLRAGATSAEIEMSWAERSDELTATYWMIRRNGRWIMDGVLCRWGEKFHWPDDELRPERKGSSGDQKPDATP